MNERAAVTVPPATVSEFLETLDSMVGGLPKRLQQCADFTRRHLHLIAVSTVSEMADSAGVAPSAYMRFCQTLGYSGYSEMQDLFRARVTEFRPNYSQRLASLQEDGTIGTDRLLAEFAESGQKSLLGLSNTVTNEGLNCAASGMAEARVIHLIGLRRAFLVVNSMSYLLEQLGVPASLHHGLGMLTSASAILPGDAVFVVTYAPFSRESVEIARSSKEKGVRVFGLSDSEKCPVAEYAEQMLIAREDEVGGFRSMTASITLTTALSVAISSKRGIR